VRAVDFVANRPPLPLLELAHSNAAPPIGRPDHRRVHELEHVPLAEGVRHDLGAAPLLEEQALEEIGGVDDLPVSEREAQMVNAAVEVVGEALDDRRQFAAVRPHEIVAEPRGQRRRGGLIAGTGPDRDLGSLGVRRLAVEIVQPVDQEALAQGPWKARMRPGASSVTANRGSARPRRFRCSKNAVQLAVSSVVPGAR
jgi:hypothetical protein